MYNNLLNYTLAPEQSQFLTIETNNAINIFMYISPLKQITELKVAVSVFKTVLFNYF